MRRTQARAPPEAPRRRRPLQGSSVALVRLHRSLPHREQDTSSALAPHSRSPLGQLWATLRQPSVCNGLILKDNIKTVCNNVPDSFGLVLRVLKV